MYQRLVLLGVTLGLLSSTAAAGTVDALDFFTFQGPSQACMTELDFYGTPCSGSWYYQYPSPTQCPGNAYVYNLVKGANPAAPYGQWGYNNEAFFYDATDGWLKIMSAIDVDHANITKNLAFRMNGRKGSRWMRRYYTTCSSSISYPQDTVDETWVYDPNYIPGGPCNPNGTAQASCNPNCQNPAPDPGYRWEGFLTSLPQHMRDLRSISLDTNELHDVQAMVFGADWYGSGPSVLDREFYYYGRWFDPVTQRWEGLGLVRWVHARSYDNGATWPDVWGSNWIALQDCAAWVECSTCPDP